MQGGEVVQGACCFARAAKDNGTIVAGVGLGCEKSRKAARGIISTRKQIGRPNLGISTIMRMTSRSRTKENEDKCMKPERRLM